VANTPKSNSIISVDKNETKNVELAKNTNQTGDYTDDIRWYEQLSGKKCKRDTHVYKGKSAGSTGGETSITSNRAIYPNLLSDDSLEGRKGDEKDTRESEYVEDVQSNKHLTETHERDIYVFEESPPNAADQEQKGAPIETSGERSESLDLLERRREDEAFSASENYTDDVLWTDPPIHPPTECEVKDYEFAPECTDEQEHYLSPTYL